MIIPSEAPPKKFAMRGANLKTTVAFLLPAMLARLDLGRGNERDYFLLQAMAVTESLSPALGKGAPSVKLTRRKT